MSKPRIFSSPETAERVLDELRARAGADGIAEASNPDLAEVLEVGPTTVFRALDRLKDEGRVSIVRKGTSRGYPTRWKIEV